MAQVIIHTANMIAFDWVNMTQAAWVSPLLPLIRKGTPEPSIGGQFKNDIIEYLSFYGRHRTGRLVDELKKYCFSSVKAIFIGSVPGRHKLTDAKWGWPKLRKVLSTIPCLRTENEPKIVIQCSSIGTLGQKDTWMTPVLFSALSSSATENGKQPDFGIIFPTVREVRDSLNGYGSGSSIHFRLVSPAQQKQFEYLKPLLHHWSSKGQGSSELRAGRDLAAPHIKTYIRFSNREDVDSTIDWALLSSANLSTQAWGAAEKDRMVRICSYEAGVLVWPGLYGGDIGMKPVFKADHREREIDAGKVISLRMPYGLPVRKYDEYDEIWSPTKKHGEPDRLGQIWNSDSN